MRIHISTIIGYIVGEIYTLHPYNKPSKIDEIVEHLKEGLSDKTDNLGYIEFETYSHIGSCAKRILMQSLPFRQLNISKSRWEQGQRDIDEDSQYKSNSANPQENDFIDLDAVFQNTVYKMRCVEENSESCFLCKYAKEYYSLEPSVCNECKNCNANPQYKFNRETHPMALRPLKSKEKQELN